MEIEDIEVGKYYLIDFGYSLKTYRVDHVLKEKNQVICSEHTYDPIEKSIYANKLFRSTDVFVEVPDPRLTRKLVRLVNKLIKWFKEL